MNNGRIPIQAAPHAHHPGTKRFVAVAQLVKPINGPDGQPRNAVQIDIEAFDFQHACMVALVQLRPLSVKQFSLQMVESTLITPL